MSIATLLVEADSLGTAGAAEAGPVWDAPFDDGDPHWLPEAEAVEPYRVPGWAYRAARR